VNPSYDAVVIGAGPAGGVAAWSLASKGWSVLLVDKASFPRDKVCGCCLSHQATQSLKSAGLNRLVERLPKNELKEFHFRMPGNYFSLPLPGGISLSRRCLDAALVEEAQKAGSAFQQETQGKLGEVCGNFREVLLTRKGRVNLILARIVLICDGLGGSALYGCEKARIAKDSRLGLNAVIEDDDDFYQDGTIYMAGSQKGYTGVVRLEDKRLNVAAAIDFPAEKGPVHFGSEISGMLEGAGFPVPRQLKKAHWRGTPPLTRTLKKVAGERYFVLGDSAAYSEPFTGEGMTWAIDSAVALGRLLTRPREDWNIRQAGAWQSWHGKNIKKRQIFSRVLTRGLKYSALLGPAATLIRWKPELAESFVQAVCGARNE